VRPLADDVGITHDVSNKMPFAVDDKHVIKVLRQENVTIFGEKLKWLTFFWDTMYTRAALVAFFAYLFFKLLIQLWGSKQVPFVLMTVAYELNDKQDIAVKCHCFLNVLVVMDQNNAVGVFVIMGAGFVYALSQCWRTTAEDPEHGHLDK